MAIKITGGKLTQEIIDENIGLIRKMAHRFSTSFHSMSCEYEDLVQQGILGLHVAAERFDPKSNPDTKFSTYAFRWIRKFIEMHVDHQKKYKVDPVSETFILSFNFNPSTQDNNSNEIEYLKIDESVHKCSFEDLFIRDEYEYIQKAMDLVLTELEKIIIRYRYFSDKKTTLSEIGKKLHLSAPRIQTIEKGALNKLFKFLKDRI